MYQCPMTDTQLPNSENPENIDCCTANGLLIATAGRKWGMEWEKGMCKVIIVGVGNLIDFLLFVHTHLAGTCVN